MNRLRRIVIALALSVSLFLIFSQAAYASTSAGTVDWASCAYYIDVGTGSILIQILIGSFVAIAAVMGVYRMRVKTFFANLFSRRNQDNENDESEESGESE